VIGEAKGFQGTTAGSVLDDTEVIGFNIEHQFWRCREEASIVKCLNGELGGGHPAGVLDHREGVLQKMQVIVIHRMSAAHTDGAVLGEKIGGNPTGPGASYFSNLCGRWGLAASHKGGSREVKA
jgi:hypothetical protein